MQVKDKCDRILGRLHSSTGQNTIPVYRPIIPAPATQVPAAQPISLRLWLQGCWNTRRRKRRFIAACCLLWALLLALIVLIILLRFLYAGPELRTLLVSPVTTSTTASAPGNAMLDLTVELNRPSDVYWVVTPVQKKQLGAGAVIDAATSAKASSLSDVAVACGQAQGPRSNTNFTFTISSGYATQECLAYQQLISGVSDEWARANRCSRCPALASGKQYQVRLAQQGAGAQFACTGCVHRSCRAPAKVP
jgi:hypothetical protein